MPSNSILESFFYVDEWVEFIIPKLSRFLLDSGAFTFFSQGKHVDWEDYLTRYIGFINKNQVERFFELDIDSLVGYKKVLEMRERLESETGRPCIPVWHKSRGREAFLEMCRDYDYVAIGGIVSGEIRQPDYRYFPWFIQQAHQNGAKIHGLGFTNLRGVERYHFDSVDSTAWACGNRFGKLYLVPVEDGFQAVVEVTEMMGSEVHVHGSVNGKEAVIIVPTVEKGRRFQPPAVGERFSLGFSTKLCHLFSRDGRNLEMWGSKFRYPK